MIDLSEATVPTPQTTPSSVNSAFAAMISLLYTPIVLLGALLVVNGAETVYDAARIARTLVDNSKLSIASMATNFPEDDSQLPNYPFSMQEYYASCHQNGSLTLLFLPISRHSRNVLHNVKHAASLSVTSESPRASKPRVSLLGEISIFTNTSSVPKEIQQCYVQRHPDSKWWLPDDDDAAHISYWARFDPRAVYFVGGFGGLHYIGYIPLELYQEAVPLEEVNPYQEQMISPREQ